MKELSKQFVTTLVVLTIFFGSIFLWNVLRGYLISRNLAKNIPIATVSSAKAKSENWESRLPAVGTLSAINGVSVSTQLPGNIVSINFKSGQTVKKDDLLVQIDDRQEQAELLDNIAAMKLAEVTYNRNKELVQTNAVSKQAFDEASARYQQAQAQVAETQALIAYKHITAPFDGRLGIRLINLGQYIKAGDPIVTLQALDPLFVNFNLPEKHLPQLSVDQSVEVKVDHVNKRYTGTINAINSLVDIDTHNIALQATIPNPNQALTPGLFARVAVVLPVRKNVVTLPQTAINYTLYGNTVYVIQYDKDKDDKKVITVHLREVRTGDQRDNKVIVLSGLKVGEEVVSSGQLKLSNGQQVTINNSVQP